MKARSGKNAKLPYYARNIARRFLLPSALMRRRLPHLLREAESRPDYDEMMKRADYYCRIQPGTPLPDNLPTLSEHRPGEQSVYFYDTFEYTRYFPPQLHWGFAPGDATELRPYPAITKCRPTEGDNANGVLLNLDKVRHFIFLNDNTPWDAKTPTAIYRGRMGRNASRRAIMECWSNSERIDAGDVSRPGRVPDNWRKPKISLYDHLTHKFILCPEGNDVASNLKWVMSTNTLAVMPRPRWETWFMEGTLEPGRHYVEVRPDYADLEEQMDYYLSRPALAKEIISEAHRHVDRFRDHRREHLTALLTLRKYFTNTNQL